MKLNISLENASSSSAVPDEEDVYRWVSAALLLAPGSHSTAAELAVRLVDEAESAALNSTYRNKNSPTNVLSFPAAIPEEIQSKLKYPLLGDLVICVPVVEKEARQQCKPVTAHWAHMLVHGSLHLIGYDHVDDNDADNMEQLETAILAKCGFANPYETSPMKLGEQQEAEQTND